jgi:DNA-binding response OmpR family regulator
MPEQQLKKVLIVEDDEVLRNAYKTKLTIDGFSVDVAEDGSVALEKAEKFAPQAIILDLLMPNMNGIDFLKEFKPKEKNVKVIVFSNTSVPAQMDEVLALGAAVFLPKASVTPNELSRMLKEELSRK